MTAPDEQGTVRPEVVLLETLLDDITAGRLRVPRFQRPFVWERHQMLELFDSIDRGFPIGSILVWETTLDIPSLDTVAGIDIPPPPTDRPVAYLLDGHQRLSTLFGALSRRPAGPVDDALQWRIYRQLGEPEQSPYLRFESGQDFFERDPRKLPLDVVLRTMDFLGFARWISRSSIAATEAEALVDEAERLAQRIKSYKIAVIRLLGGSLSHAVESFARLNSGGREIAPHDLVSALTYRTTEDSLTDRIHAIQRGVAAGGIGVVEADAIFRTFLVIGGELEGWRMHWTAVAASLSHRLDEITDKVSAAVSRAVRFLRYEAGVPHLKLLPYSAQIPLLAAAFDATPEPDDARTRWLVRWFWTTSWSGSVRQHYAQTAMMMQAPGHLDKPDATVSGHPRAFPHSFDSEGGRLRAYLLWEMQQYPQRLGLDGRPIDAVQTFVAAGTAAYHPIFSDLPLSPGNALLLAGSSPDNLAQALRKLPPRRLREVVTSHGIVADSLNALLEGNGRRFVDRRAAFLARRERAFMLDMGAEPAPGESAETRYDA